MTQATPLRLPAMLGDYPVSAALKRGDIRSQRVTLDWADVKVPSSAFKRVVRGMEFDCAELAIVTYLIARAHGIPLVLLPAVMVGRFQHPYLIYNSERGPLRPEDLTGKRIGIRSYSVTTVTWVRGILANDYGVDLDRCRWVTFEDPHVAQFRDPPSVERAPEGKDLIGMLLAGEIDAAIGGDRLPSDARIKTVIADPAAAARAWREKYQALQINHMVVVKESLDRSDPDAVREIYRMLAESKRAGGLPVAGELDSNPFGVSTNLKKILTDSLTHMAQSIG